MVNAIIFDLDGTLADTMDDLMTAVNKMLVTLGYDTRTKAELIRFINRGTRAFVKQSLPLEVQDVEFIVDSGIEIYKEEYEKCYLEKTYAFDGIKEALEGLKERGLKLAVLSNKPDKFVKDICNKLFGKKLFKVVMGQSDLPTKPDPSSALLISRLIGAKPSRCIVVGDSDVDVKTAQNAGMEFVGVSWGYRSERVLSDAGAKYIVEDTEGLISTVEEIVKRVNAKKKRFSKAKNTESPLKEEVKLTEENLIEEELEQEPTLEKISEIESK